MRSRSEPGERQHGVEGNSRLTATVGLVLLVLLAVEGVTILRIGPLLTEHVVIGALLLPPVLLKVGSTTYRMVAYYRRAPAYRRKGPPLLVLRLLGPFVVLLTVEVLATGVALLYLGSSWHHRLLLLHKAGFIVWLGAMGIHVLGHFAETFKESWRDWAPARRWRLGGAGARRALVIGSLVLGAVVAVLLAPRIGG
jgi:hypothetical protein